MCYIMLIPIAYGPHQVRSAYLTIVNMISLNVFMMFVDFKTDSETISRQHRKEGAVNHRGGRGELSPGDRCRVRLQS